LIGAKGRTPEEMARQLYHSLRSVYLPLPDATEIWPAHGAGSSCGKALSEERVSTLGRQKAENPALHLVVEGDEEGFVRYATEGLGVAPAYFGHDAEKNRVGADSLTDVLAAARPLSAPEAEEYSENGAALVLDTRPVGDFGAGHLPGALNVPLEGRFAPFVGLVLSPDAPLLVVAEPGTENEALMRLARIGYERIIGWLHGGMAAWEAAGGEIQRIPQVTPEELRARLKSPQTRNTPLILDVRTPAEREEDPLAGSLAIPLAELPTRMAELPTDETIVVLCGSGYRSGIACSLLQRAGRRPENLTGGWAAFHPEGR
jgi:rhodanese-related sulfurtransferase